MTHINQEKSFIKFKNFLLTKRSFYDLNTYTHPLGVIDDHFWSEFSEQEPYSKSISHKFSAVEKGILILERLAIEPSPKRCIEMLQTMHDTFQYFSNLPPRWGAPNWHGEREVYDIRENFIGLIEMSLAKSGFKGLKIEEEKELFGSTGFVLSYTEKDFNEEESFEITKNSFFSETVEEVKKRKEVQYIKSPWWKFWNSYEETKKIEECFSAGVNVGIGEIKYSKKTISE